MENLAPTGIIPPDRPARGTYGFFLIKVTSSLNFCELRMCSYSRLFIRIGLFFNCSFYLPYFPSEDAHFPWKSPQKSQRVLTMDDEL